MAVAIRDQPRFIKSDSLSRELLGIDREPVHHDVQIRFPDRDSKFARRILMAVV
jgi:hypothetical protein